MKYAIYFLNVLLIIIVICSCMKDTGPIYNSYSGIVVTDETGQILEDDPEDWQPRIFVPKYRYESFIYTEFLYTLPAYPNPFNPSTTITFSINDSARVKININKSPTEIVRELFDKELLAGKYQYLIGKEDLDPGIYRVYIYAYKDDKVYKTFGDIEILE